MKSLNYLMEHILYHIIKITLNISLKKHESVTDNPSIMIYLNKIENKITFKIKTGYYHELLTPETIELLGSTKIKITISKIQESCIHLFLISHLVNTRYFTKKNYIFKNF